MSDTQPNQHELIKDSGLFDVIWYSDTYTDGSGVSGQGLAAHYLTIGSKRGWRPNPYFDPGWYAEQNPDLASKGLDALTHYILHGERDGRAPIAWFDPAWYARHYEIPLGRALRHYLQ